MSDMDGAPGGPMISRPERSGNIGLLIGLALLLVGAAAAFAVMDREVAQPFILALLGILAVVGVFCLFAGAIGFLRLSARPGEANPLAAAFVDTMEDGALITDMDGRLVYANKAYADLTGADSAADITVVERVFSSDPDAADAIFRLSQAMRDGRKAQEEIRMPFPLGRVEGTARWYRVSVRPLQPEHERGGRQRAIWQLADITRDRAEQENSFQELQRAINFLDHAPAGFFSSDAHGRLVYLNATLADWLGYDLAQFDAGDLDLSEIVRGDGTELIRSVKGQAGEVKSETFDLDFVTRNGRGLPVRLLHRVPFGENGQPGDSRTLVLNRSRGEEASEALRAAEVRFARFFNNTPISIASLNNDGRVLRTNAPFLKLFGAVDSVEESPKLEAYVAESGREELSKALSAAANGIGEVSPIDIPLVEGNDPRSATFYVSAVQDGEGDGETTIVYALETTQQRALEAQFAQSQKMQAIGQLAGGVAHDFNNVLTAIIGFSDLLLASHRPTDPSFQDIMNIKQNANRAAGLVRQLLAFSRRQTLRPQRLELNDVLADLSILLDRLLGEKVELKVVHGRDLWPVMADLNQLEQVIVNLAVNAGDAMAEGGRLTIRTRNVEEAESTQFENTRGMPPGEYTLVEVNDTGHGMPPEIMEKIFDPFFSTKEVGKGTGLGLSTVYGIVKQTGGFIFCTSEVDAGTTFRLFLPRHIPDVVDEPKPEPKESEPEKVADLTGSASILLVEDEEAVRAFAARALTSRGYTVHEAGTGNEALEVMEETDGEIDLVVSDVVMPEMDGPTLLVELRKTQPDLKIIFVSGYAEDAFEENLPEGEQFFFLPKPFTLKQLATTVKDVLNG
ncbi:MAG: response regulator [Roseibium album]|uniref:cell cycle histidine kinase CckA n=1 Tax=Roseibium album TaxID=311410 RepID=UPI000CF0A55E|nr:response regulator [Roseibium album]MBG6143150.1 two-component system cell cycle sensor histidine kinase/response regulator CckA [Labrenzia sp. EL_142]MBG6157112.1 two-component system cell cycle sensor histidine kinase/response regulator CckA [Labrenzia sp. EL_162]MBG6166439.1 two-component system cell cycle sensor histidine kinase/response regulator CckA [Labrenzia sp. EL_195]MBG6172362.1 two-component system cell cycle sensor histidine kinase/response regulator CckA [Labrenzia sp. EL_132]